MTGSIADLDLWRLAQAAAPWSSDPLDDVDITYDADTGTYTARPSEHGL